MYILTRWVQYVYIQVLNYFLPLFRTATLTSSASASSPTSLSSCMTPFQSLEYSGGSFLDRKSWNSSRRQLFGSPRCLLSRFLVRFALLGKRRPAMSSHLSAAQSRMLSCCCSSSSSVLYLMRVKSPIVGRASVYTNGCGYRFSIMQLRRIYNTIIIIVKFI